MLEALTTLILFPMVIIFTVMTLILIFAYVVDAIKDMFT
jgi:hypothetical protein